MSEKSTLDVPAEMPKLGLSYEQAKAHNEAAVSGSLPKQVPEIPFNDAHEEVMPGWIKK